MDRPDKELLKMDEDLKKQLQVLSSKTAEHEEALSGITKKLDEQFRFTRNVIVLCSLANLGLVIFTVLSVSQSMPSQINAHYMSNLEPIVKMWHHYEQQNANGSKQTGRLD